MSKFIIFVHHQAMMNAIQDRILNECKEHGLKLEFIRIDGNVPSEERMNMVNRFQDDNKVRIAILSITAASTGLTLTKAQTVIFAEYIWTPSIMIQAEDRAHRIGQKNSVNVIYLHAEGTSDDLLDKILEKKLKMVGLILDGKEQILEMKVKNKV